MIEYISYRRRTLVDNKPSRVSTGFVSVLNPASAVSDDLFYKLIFGENYCHASKPNTHSHIGQRFP